MRIVVTGADGFLGRHILERLRKEGLHEVVGVTLCPDVLTKAFDGWSALEVVLADLDEMASSDALAQADVLIACAFPRVAGSEGMAEGLDFVFGSIGLMLDMGCRSVINVSSQSVYDPRRTRPARETDAPVLTDSYAIAKYCVELSVARMCRDACVPYTNVRMASLIGPSFDQRFVNRMVRLAMEMGEISVKENGSLYGFLDVRDAADALATLATSDPTCWPATCNLGATASYTTTEVGKAVKGVLEEMIPGLPIRLEIDAGGAPTNSSLEEGVLEDAIGWSANHVLRDTVRSIVRDLIGDVNSDEGDGYGGVGLACGNVR